MWNKIGLLAFVTILSFAQIDISRIESNLSDFNAYLTQNGDEVTVVVPISSVFTGETTFVQGRARPLVETLIDLIAQSKGTVQLEAMITPTEDGNQALSSSIAYTQVVELSKVLLQSGGEISYAPLTLKIKPRNNEYGFWKRFTTENRFIKMTLSID